MIEIKLDQCLFKKCLRVLNLNKSNPMEVKNKNLKTILCKDIEPIVFDLDFLYGMFVHALAIPWQVNRSDTMPIHIKH